MSGVATLLKEGLPGYNGKMNLYRLDPPFRYYDYAEGGEASTGYVLVSAAHVAYLGRDETYIFPADGPDATEPSDWLELPGSLNGVLSHEEALRAAGYEVNTNPQEETP